MLFGENDRVRLLSRNGTDWTMRYPWIAEAALKNRQKHFVIDGEAVNLGVDGISDFNACTLASMTTKFSSTPSIFSRGPRRPAAFAPRYAQEPTWSSYWLAGQTDHRGLFRARRDRLFRAACRMGLEGLVSKHRERLYLGAGRSIGSR
nr:DNA ligase [Bradyrhizobium sp. 141]